MERIEEAFKKAAVGFWNDEDAQGMIEYILILVAVVAIVTVAGTRIKGMVATKAGELDKSVSSFSVE